MIRPRQTKRKGLEAGVGMTTHGGRPPAPKQEERATITGSKVLVGLKVGLGETLESHTIQ